MSEYITYHAPCPSCGELVLWTASSGSVSREQNRFVIECTSCDNKEQKWLKGQKREALTRTVAERAKQDMRTRAALPVGTGNAERAGVESPGSS